MASETKKIYEFGSFRFDAQCLQLEHAGQYVNNSTEIFGNTEISTRTARHDRNAGKAAGKSLG